MSFFSYDIYNLQMILCCVVRYVWLNIIYLEYILNAWEEKETSWLIPWGWICLLFWDGEERYLHITIVVLDAYSIRYERFEKKQRAETNCFVCKRGLYIELVCKAFAWRILSVHVSFTVSILRPLYICIVSFITRKTQLLIFFLEVFRPTDVYLN